METSKKRIRREYAPLNVAISLRCDTTGSLPTQVYNADNAQFEPDRSLTPCVIIPVVIAHAKDGSWKNPYANSALGQIQWLVNGKDITLQQDWMNLYSINLENGNDRGAITIKRNIMPGSVCSLRFKAVLADIRTGMSIPIESEEISLSTTDKTEDTYSLSIGESQIIRYDPFKDRLIVYEYKVSHGLMQESRNKELEAMDENCYRCNIPLTVHKGVDTISTGYTVHLYRVQETGALVEYTDASGPSEVASIATDNISLDLRLVTKADYIIRIKVDGEQVAQEQFSVNRIYAPYICMPTNGTSIGPRDTERYDVANVQCDGNKVECPQVVLSMNWKTDSEHKTGVFHNEGAETLFLLEKTGIGKTYRDDWLDVYIEAFHKPAHSIATDESGSLLSDENGNILIFN